MTGRLGLAAGGLALGVLAGLALVQWGTAAPAVAGRAGDILVSQRNHSFAPGHVELSRGGSLVVVNDDGNVIHHAYVDSSAYKFDSGDQEPGDRATLTFDSAGTYKVLCGIHPRMRLDVEVR